MQLMHWSNSSAMNEHYMHCCVEQALRVPRKRCHDRDIFITKRTNKTQCMAYRTAPLAATLSDLKGQQLFFSLKTTVLFRSTPTRSQTSRTGRFWPFVALFREMRSSQSVDKSSPNTRLSRHFTITIANGTIIGLSTRRVREQIFRTNSLPFQRLHSIPIPFPFPSET